MISELDLRRDPLQLLPYSRDLAELPGFLVQPWFQPMPQVVALPRSLSDVVAAVGTARKEQMKITPRAGGSTAYFNAVPTTGGMVVDMTQMGSLEEVDLAGETAVVQAGMTWSNLEGELAYYGLACRSYPSSAPAASIGGWFSGLGFGLGTLQYGPFSESVTGAEVVLPSGEVRWLKHDTDHPLTWFSGSEGTLGILTRLKIKLRRSAAEKRHWMMAVQTNAVLQQIITALAKLEHRPFSMHFEDPSYVRALKGLGYLPQTIPETHLLRIDVFETVQPVEKDIYALSLATGAKILDEGLAQKEWDSRFKSLRLKRLAPTLIGAEILLPLNSLAAYNDRLAQLSKKKAGNLYTYGHIVSPDFAMVMTLIPTDANATFTYLLDLAFTYKLQRLGLSLGGRPYGVGLWNVPYQKQALSSENLKELRRRKRAIDPENLINPDKFCDWRAYLRPAIFHPMMTTSNFLTKG